MAQLLVTSCLQPSFNCPINQLIMSSCPIQQLQTILQLRLYPSSCSLAQSQLSFSPVGLKQAVLQLSFKCIVQYQLSYSPVVIKQPSFSPAPTVLQPSCKLLSQVMSIHCSVHLLCLNSGNVYTLFRFHNGNVLYTVPLYNLGNVYAPFR